MLRITDVTVERADVYAAGIPDEPGALASVLAALAEAGADLDFLIARRSSKEPGTGVVFLTPLGGDLQLDAATDLGFNVTRSVHSVRVEGLNEPGMLAELTRKVATAGINLRGVSAAAIGARFVVYLGLDSAADADRVEALLGER